MRLERIKFKCYTEGLGGVKVWQSTSDLGVFKSIENMIYNKKSF